MKRGRPKGRSADKRSFGPLGDLIRSHRLAKGLGLAEIADACQCSAQFVSNIEHGRAPLPWEKVDLLAAVLAIPSEKLQAANLAIRSDFRSFVGASSGLKRPSHTRARKPASLSGSATTASAVAFAAQDTQLQGLIRRYETASVESRKKFLRAAAAML